MNAITKFGTAAMVATAAGLTLGLAPATAAPTQSGANLWVFPDPANSANYRVTVKGMYPMSEYDAHGYINNISNDSTPGYILYIIAGDDGRTQIIENVRYDGAGPRDGGYLRAEADGIHFLQEISVPRDYLNEDSDGADEVFVAARFVDVDQGVRTAYTNVVTGEF
jgi:hypothetical protein